MNSVPGCSKTGKALRLVVHGDQERFEDFAWTLVVGKQVVGVAAFGAFAHDLHAGAFFDELGAALRDVVVAKQR